MYNQINQMAKLTLLGFILLFLITGCSKGSSNPIAGSTSFEPAGAGNLDTLPIIAFDGNTAVGVMGGFNLTISPDGTNADLVPMRTSAIGESYIFSGKSYFDTFPCRDCFRISGLGYEDGQIIIRFSIRHPFPKGNPALPPSGRNRLDLDLFDLALVVKPIPLSPQNYPLMNINIPEYIIENPDGFTDELSNLISADVALPYVLVVDDSVSAPPSSTFNKFEMGASKDFEVKFPVQSGETLVFDLYLTFGLGASAIFEDRLNPVYLNPEFNRKAAWKVEVIPPNGTNPPTLGNTWDDTHSANAYKVTVKVYDWQIGANVDPNLTNTTDIYAASDVDYVSVEIPGMTDVLKQVDGNSYVPGGTGMPDSPLVYKILIANENLLEPGEYIGLVEVHDQREPQDFAEGRDYLIHSPDGVTLNQYQIGNYKTYQTFIATVVTGGILGGDLIWAKRAGGTHSDYGRAITTLSDNSTVVTGIFYDSATFGPDEPNETVLTSAGGWDIFITRYNPDGTLAWAKRAGGSSYDEGKAITTLSDNSTVVTGRFEGSVTFGPGESAETILTSAGMFDIFIARYNPNGTLAWAKSAGGSSNVISCAITTLSDNSTVVTGCFRGSATFGPGESAETILTSAGSIDIFVAKYDWDGTLAWAKRAGGSDYDRSGGITSLSDNSTVVTGNFRGSAIFGPGEPNELVLISAGNDDIFIAKYNPDGTFAWAKRAGGSTFDGSNAITTLSDNSTVVTGDFSGTVTFGEGEINQTVLTSVPGTRDIFIARFEP